MKKKLGKGSISLLLVALALIWNCNLPVLDGKCLGDIVLTALGFPTWSNGTSGLHITVFLSLVLFIPAFVLAVRNKNDLFAKTGMWISGIFSTGFIVMGMTILLFTGRGEGGSYQIIYGTVQDRAMAKMNKYDYSGHAYISIELEDGSTEMFWFGDGNQACDAQIGDYVMIEADMDEGSDYKIAVCIEVLED